MKRTELRQEIRKMRWDEVFNGWKHRRLTQEQAALILGVSDRTFRRYVDRYEDHGLEGLEDKRVTQASHRAAPVDEVLRLLEQYKSRHMGWNVKHFFGWYVRDGGKRKYTWVKNELQKAGLVKKAKKRQAHRTRREPAPIPGMMLHQDASTHQWVAGKYWDLIVTMDDATNEHYSMFFCDEEGTHSSFRGVREVITSHGLFSSIYTDRGSHYWHTAEAGGKVDKKNVTQFGRAMHQLGIEMIAAYSPEARGRSERAFKTHQDRLVKELALHGITTMDEANRYLEGYRRRFNEELAHEPAQPGSAFIPMIMGSLDDILCEHHDRTVGKDNCVSFEGVTLQIPADTYRCNYVKVKIRVHRYNDRSLAIFHGPRKLAAYDQYGNLVQETAAA